MAYNQDLRRALTRALMEVPEVAELGPATISVENTSFGDATWPTPPAGGTTSPGG